MSSTWEAGSPQKPEVPKNSSSDEYPKYRFKARQERNQNRKVNDRMKTTEAKHDNIHEMTNHNRARVARFQQQQLDIKKDYGYISRGEDSRLQRSSREREEYFNTILHQFIGYCESNSASTLSRNLQSYIDSTQISDDLKEKPDVPNSVDSILGSLRKLREALLHATPDSFTKKVYLFSIRVSSTIGHYQTYIPSIMYLLESGILSEGEIQEVSTLLILHVSHFNQNNSKALYYYFKYSPSLRILQIVKCWIHRDYYGWIRLYNAETNNSISRIMRFGIPVIMRAFVAAIQSSYFNYDWTHLKENLPNGTDWDTLVNEYNVKWSKEGVNLVVRTRK